mmetsp:Transcript_134441/g.261803  ORF Transcript_134441/g.261803 Transcript_134441/m.261803 type:complete len:131 (-) Transcript_134441:297-689(-)
MSTGNKLVSSGASQQQQVQRSVPAEQKIVHLQAAVRKQVTPVSKKTDGGLVASASAHREWRTRSENQGAGAAEHLIFRPVNKLCRCTSDRNFHTRCNQGVFRYNTICSAATAMASSSGSQSRSSNRQVHE